MSVLGFKLEQVHAALAYFYANREEIDADIVRQDKACARVEAELMSMEWKNVRDSSKRHFPMSRNPLIEAIHEARYELQTGG